MWDILSNHFEFKLKILNWVFLQFSKKWLKTIVKGLILPYHDLEPYNGNLTRYRSFSSIKKSHLMIAVKRKQKELFLDSQLLLKFWKI